jgi:hypothetical protein
LLVLVLAAVLAPARHPAAAQCGMPGMSGGGHEQHAKSVPQSEGKTRKSVERLLGDERSRAVIADMLLADAAFMREFVPRIAAAPEWRALLAARMGPTTVGVAPAPADSAARVNPAPPARAAQLVYSCPMHPEARSDHPGNCPKCGMTLVRKQGAADDR